jgi:hypothetical protein
MANNIRVRRASHALSRATTLNEVFDAVKEMLELNSFVYATVQLNRGGEWMRGQAQNTDLARKTKVHNGCVYWSWESGSLDTAEILRSSRIWALSMSLSTEHSQWGYINLYRSVDSENLLLDINYLCNFFQHQMALAIERIVDGTASQSTMGPGERSNTQFGVKGLARLAPAPAQLKANGF